MKNSKNPARKPATHFEQIPIEVVKTIAEVAGPKVVTAAPTTVAGKPASALSSLKR